MNETVAFLLGSSLTAWLVFRNQAPIIIDKQRKGDKWIDLVHTIDFGLFSYYSYWINDHSELTRSVCPSAVQTVHRGLTMRPVVVIN